MTCPSGICGVQGWEGPAPGDPNNDSILSATTVFGGILVSWTYPSTNPYALAYTRVFRGVTAVFASAIEIGQSGGSTYMDRLETELTYYYWIKFVSVNGTVLSEIGPASATAMPSIQQQMIALTGQIDSGLLAISLRNELDQISILNTNLLAETFDRETGETTLAAAMVAVEAGVAAANTFIIDEIASRTTDQSAIITSIDALAVTLGDDIAAVSTTLTASIDEVTGVVYASWSAQVNVDGMIGGFGLMGSATEVEAGFDVDTFWIGRTDGTSKIKPFIVSGGVVYIDNARIVDLDASHIAAGTITTDRIEVGAATAAVAAASTGLSTSFTTANSSTLTKADAVTFVSTGAPVTKSGTLDVVVSCTGGTPVSLELSLTETMDGSTAYARNVIVAGVFQVVGGTRLFKISIPMLYHSSPSAASHTYGFILQALFYDAVGASTNCTGTLGANCFVVAQENKV